MRKKIKLNVGLESAKGVRQTNEDACWFGQNNKNQFLALVCDGIGSQENSSLASKITKDIFANSFKEHRFIRNVKKWFEKNLNHAFQEITFLSNSRFQGKKIGTTLLLVLFDRKKLWVFNLGDSRLYKATALTEVWEKITRDNNLYNYLIDIKATPEVFENYKNSLASLTRCIESGSVNQLMYDKYVLEMNNGDVLFLATDGLYNYINVQFITNYIKNNRNKDFGNVVKESIKQALQNNSNDNLTGIVIEYYDKCQNE